VVLITPDETGKIKFGTHMMKSKHSYDCQNGLSKKNKHLISISVKILMCQKLFTTKAKRENNMNFSWHWII